MKLPRQLELEEVESDVLTILKKESVALSDGSTTHIPVLKPNPELRKQILFAKFLGHLIIGYGTVEKTLDNELHGLQKAQNKSNRVSRVLIVTHDGSPRFYRELEFLQKKHGERVLICRLDVDSVTMGDILELKDKKVKAILLNRKESVVNVLKSLI